MEKHTYMDTAERMALNYRKLFFIEQHLKENIESDTYQYNLYFHEYIPLLSKNVYPDKLRKKLYKLVKVRNKICHMNCLEVEEELFLEEIYHRIRALHNIDYF